MTKITTDSKGQMELDGIDTPLGEAAECLVKAAAQLKGAKSNYQEKMDVLIEEMRKAKIRTLRFKGDTLKYKPGHTTPDKIQWTPGGE